MESKEHRKQRKKNTKYSYMEKCEIKHTREVPYQLKYMEKLKRLQDEKKTSNENKEIDEERDFS